jgi:hypothetical protein
MMLKEYRTVRPPRDAQRRWFADEYFDLIVWFGDDSSIWGFQLCYDRGRSERALTWTATDGYSHDRIDDGEANPTKNRSPILVPDGTFDAHPILARLSSGSVSIDRPVREFIEDKIRSYTRPSQNALSK